MATATTLSRRTFLRASGAAAWLASLAGDAVSAERRAELRVVDDVIRRQSAAAPLRMAFRGTTAKECRAWQAQFAAKLREMLGPHQPPPHWETVTEDETELDDHIRRQLLLVADGHPTLPVYLLIPKGRGAARCPGILALHGHGAFGYDPVAGRDDLPGVANAIAGANYDYGRQLVRRGYAVAAPCMTPFGRRVDRDAYGDQDPCAVTFVRMQLLGKVLMGENLRDCLWAFEMLARDDRVDAGRMGCVGLSYGGRMTMLTAALEPRIRVAVISGALNVMQERIAGRYSCGAQVIPGLLQYGDVPEIGSLIAPRPCIWETGSRDGLILPAWADAAFDKMKRAYRAYDAEDRLLRDRFDGGHRFHGTMAYPALAKVFGT